MHPNVNNFDGIRTFRVLRALKTISTVKGKGNQMYFNFLLFLNGVSSSPFCRKKGFVYSEAVVQKKN